MGEDDRKDMSNAYCYFGCGRCVNCINNKVKRERGNYSSYCSKNKYEKKSILSVLFKKH